MLRKRSASVVQTSCAHARNSCARGVAVQTAPAVEHFPPPDLSIARGIATLDRNPRDYTETRRNQVVHQYAAITGRRFTLNELVEFGQNMTSGKLIQSARHLHRELPLRLAQRIVDFQQQPYSLVSNPHFKQVYNKYNDAFDRLRQFPRITSVEDEHDFTKLVETLVAEHIDVIPALGKGLAEVKAYMPTDITPFMDRLLMTRISRRVLAEQHIALHSAVKGRPRRGYVGVVRLELTLEQVLRMCYEKAAGICERTYGYCPPLKIEGHEGAKLSYIPVHLEYMLLELVKNALRSTVEKAEAEVVGGAEYGQGDGSGAVKERLQARPIVATIAATPAHLTLRISDRGGGIDPELERSVWNYGFSSVPASNVYRSRTFQNDGLGALGGGSGPDPNTEADPIVNARPRHPVLAQSG